MERRTFLSSIAALCMGHRFPIPKPEPTKITEAGVFHSPSVQSAAYAYYGSVIECYAGEDLVVGDRVAIRKDGLAYRYLVTKDWRWLGTVRHVKTWRDGPTKVHIQVDHRNLSC